MRKNKNFFYVLFYLLCFIIIQGCGQTGDLYLPEETSIQKEKDEYRA